MNPHQQSAIDAALADLERAAAAGMPDAMTALGMRLLAGDAGAYDPVRGATLLEAAARRGSGEACAMVAVLAGAGSCRAQSWEEALDWLQRAAALGWAPARAQLSLLSAEPALAARAGDAADPALWQALRRSIDLPAWTRLPPKQSLCESPRVRRYEGFLQPAVCEWMMRQARQRLLRARVYAPDGTPALSGSRTNSETDFNIVQSDLPLLLVRERIAAMLRIPAGLLELTKVLHYTPGQSFDPHYDFIDPATPGFAAEHAARGQRMFTVLVYLNADYQGGETDFPKAGLRHRGTTGDALVFANVDGQGQPDPASLHAGLAPTTGEKWLLSQWVRDRFPAPH